MNKNYFSFYSGKGCLLVLSLFLYYQYLIIPPPKKNSYFFLMKKKVFTLSYSLPVDTTEVVWNFYLVCIHLKHCAIKILSLTPTKKYSFNYFHQLFPSYSFFNLIKCILFWMFPTQNNHKHLRWYISYLPWFDLYTLYICIKISRGTP